MFEEYKDAGGKLSRDEFDRHLNEKAQSISRHYHSCLRPSCSEIQQIAFEHIMGVLRR